MYKKHLELETESSTSTIERFKAEKYRPKSLGCASSAKGKVVRLHSEPDAVDNGYLNQNQNLQSDITSINSSEEIYKHTMVKKPFKSALKPVRTGEIDYLASSVNQDGAVSNRTADK